MNPPALHTIANDPELAAAAERHRRDKARRDTDWLTAPPPEVTGYEHMPESRGLERDRGDPPAEREQQDREKQAPSLLKLTWASDLETDQQYGPPLVPGLFERKGVAMMFGASGTGKSTLMIDLACRIACGMP